jgi:NTE family protein
VATATKQKPINIALQGGGVHGAAVWGALDAVLKDGRISIEAVSGASAGSVNAVALASGLHEGGAEGAREKLELMWRRISNRGAIFSTIKCSYGGDTFGTALSHAWFDAITRSFSPYQLNPFNINPLREVLAETIDFGALRQCVRPRLYLAATNVRTGRAHIFRNSEASVDAVCASACLPNVFKAVEIDGEAYWDGGYMGNPVLYPFFYESASSDVVIVHINPIEREEVPATAPAIMDRINEITFNASLLRELRAIDFVRRLIEQGMLKEDAKMRLRNIRIHSIRTDQALLNHSASSKFDVDWGFISALKAEGERVGRAWIDATFDKIGKEPSIDIRKMFEGD